MNPVEQMWKPTYVGQKPLLRFSAREGSRSRMAVGPQAGLGEVVFIFRLFFRGKVPVVPKHARGHPAFCCCPTSVLVSWSEKLGTVLCPHALVQHHFFSPGCLRMSDGTTALLGHVWEVSTETPLGTLPSRNQWPHLHLMNSTFPNHLFFSSD